MWPRRVVARVTMANTCPDCGASMEFAEREVRLRTGVCPSCASEFAFVEGHDVAAHLGASESEKEGGSEAAEGSPSPTSTGPECEECGSPLSIQLGRRGSLEVSCEECDTTTVYVAKPPDREPARERASPPGEGPPRGRPCRRCGAPLRFSTGEDGMLVGECEACGNRFTLPPRPDRGTGGRRYGGTSRYGRRDFRRGPSERPSYRGRERRGDSGFDDRDRPRKRRRTRDE